MKVFRDQPQEWTCIVEPVAKDIASLRVLNFADKRSLSRLWKPVRVKLLTEHPTSGSSLQTADFMRSTFGMVLSRRAKVALEESIGDRAEFLPLECADFDVYAINVTRVVDALDIENSLITNRATMTSDTILTSRVAFKSSAVQREMIFRLPQRTIPFIFLCDPFLEEVSKHRLSGFGTKVEWEDQL